MLLLLLGCIAIGSDNSTVLRDTGRVCAVDMGSNTFKFIVGEIKNGEYVQYLDERIVAGVGDDIKASQQKLGKKLISDEKLQQVLILLAGFQNQCEKQTGSRKLSAIATAAFREAENIDSVLSKIQAQGIEMNVLTPAEESAFAYDAATLGKTGFAVLDLGSRTTEFVNRKEADYVWTLLNTGYKIAWDDFYEKAATFSQASFQHLASLNTLIRDQDVKILQNQRELVVIEVGETAAYILGIPQDQIEGKVITRLQLQSRLKDLHKMNAESFADLKRTFKDAARVIPRAVFLELILERTGYNSFRCTNRELNVAIILRGTYGM